jgi:NAD+ diphosphatase
VDSDLLPLSRSEIDRDTASRSRPIADLLAEAPRTRVLRVRRGTVPLEVDGVSLAFASSPTPGVELAYLGKDSDGVVYVSELDGDDVEAVRGPDDPQGAGGGALLRDIGWRLPARDAGLAATAVALAGWHERHPRCPRCGARTRVAVAGWERHCEEDGSMHYPRTDPAVIMAIVDDEDRLLLGHAVSWPERQFSVPAGFVEPGESLEAAVRREVAEETNVVVGEVTYSGSQPWPFPASLMLGFRGRAVETDVRPDGEEITEAMFVSREQVRALIEERAIRLPRPTSIAHHLIAGWYGDALPTGADWVAPPPPS